MLVGRVGCVTPTGNISIDMQGIVATGAGTNCTYTQVHRCNSLLAGESYILWAITSVHCNISIFYVILHNINVMIVMYECYYRITYIFYTLMKDIIHPQCRSFCSFRFSVHTTVFSIHTPPRNYEQWITHAEVDFGNYQNIFIIIIMQRVLRACT